jgi:hypothetical protein
LLRCNLVLKVRYLLFVLGNLHIDLKNMVGRYGTTGSSGLRHIMLMLTVLQCFDLLKKLVKKQKRLRSQGLIQDLSVEMTSLYSHLNLLNKQSQLTGAGRA